MNIKNLKELDNLEELLIKANKEYSYQEELTKQLDGHNEDFTELHLLKIILWKLNRYPNKITEELITLLNDLKKDYAENKARICFTHLLLIKGIDLAMASTILRFLLPEQFQIIDQRAYRILYGKELPIYIAEKDKLVIYFNYLQDLKAVCSQLGIPFNQSDRLLYQLDKMVNREHPLKKYGTKNNKEEI